MGEELERLVGLDGGGEVDGSGEDAGGVAGFYCAGGWGWEDAGQAGGGGGGGAMGRVRAVNLGAGEDGHGGGVRADGGGVDPGPGLLYGVIVEEVAGFEVVCAIEEELGRGEECVDVGGDEIRNVRGQGNGGVEGGDLAAGGFGFGERGQGVGFIKQDLTLKVGWFYEVAVDKDELADAGAGEE